MSPIVYLNVGGCYFSTRRETLNRGFFLGLSESIDQDGTEIFVDRDPTHFRYILNWLRGMRCLPEDDQVLRELLCEADFYALDDMVSSISSSHGVSLSKSLNNIATSLRR